MSDWSGLPSLIDVWHQGNEYRFEDADITSELMLVAEKLVTDVRKHKRGSTSDFLNEMAKQTRRLTPRQCRGVLNVAMGNIRGRHHYFQSRFHRNDLGAGLEDCLVCGAPLTDDIAVEKGVGPTCYESVLGI